MESFFSILERSCRKKQSLLCVGLDPSPERRGAGELPDSLVEENARVIEQTCAYAACFKANIACYEAHGPEGLRALKATLEKIPADTPVILDAKRSDVGHTAAGYAEAAFGYFGAQAVTLNPYLGREGVTPFQRYSGKGLFLVCRSTNPGAGAIQELEVRGIDGQKGPLYLELARQAVSWGPEIGVVAGATAVEALRRIRQEHPELWILCPGVGPQGGDLEEAVRAGIRADGLGLLMAVSRGIYRAPDPGQAALSLRDRINRQRRQPAESSSPPSLSPEQFSEQGGAKRRLLEEILRRGCLRFGTFKLKSGEISPYYLDLRKIVSSPLLLSRVADAYTELLAGLDFRRLAAIPLAALPIATAVSLKTGLPIIYPRLKLKDHGTGNRIEGDFKRGERVVLLDDVLSSAHSKLEAVEVLEECGLEVRDLVVLVDREGCGREELKRRGIRTHAYARISELLELNSAGGEEEADPPQPEKRPAKRAAKAFAIHRG